VAIEAITTGTVEEANRREAREAKEMATSSKVNNPTINRPPYRQLANTMNLSEYCEHGLHKQTLA